MKMFQPHKHMQRGKKVHEQQVHPYLCGVCVTWYRRIDFLITFGIVFTWSGSGSASANVCRVGCSYWIPKTSPFIWHNKHINVAPGLTHTHIHSQAHQTTSYGKQFAMEHRVVSCRGTRKFHWNEGCKLQRMRNRNHVGWQENQQRVSFAVLINGILVFALSWRFQWRRFNRVFSFVHTMKLFTRLKEPDGWHIFAIKSHWITKMVKKKM